MLVVRVKIALDLVQHDMLTQLATDIREANEIFRQTLTLNEFKSRKIEKWLPSETE